ncbi:MAG: RNA polymerase sporulation sigma factor SigK [Firmicutes bacterium]|nr:RNA polymerase sporulation sigma factor SigK [Bacillota bacterium]
MIIESFMAFLSRIFFFASFVGNGGSFPKPLSKEEEIKCIHEVKAGNLQAREKLIKYNLRLVAHVVKKFQSAGEADDLISVGSIGLIKGIESFEFGKNSSLATYCGKCIENEILMYIRSAKKHKATSSLHEAVGVDKDGNEIMMIDVLPIKEVGVGTMVETNIMYEMVLKIIEKSLGKREREIIKKRYGVGCEAMTQLQISAQMDISRSYVSRIEKKALSKIYKELSVFDRE